MIYNKRREFKLGEVTVSFNSKRVPLSKKERGSLSGIYPYYGAQGIIDWINDYIFEGEYLLVAEDGANLTTRSQDIAILTKQNEKFWVNNHAHILKSNHLSDIRYIKYFLNASDLSGYITGSAQPKLNKANLSKIKIELPRLYEQKSIANILSTLDDKIDTNNQINGKLEEMAQALFKHWFIDFQFPNQNGKAYKTSGGEMVDSELGMIPKGWEVASLKELVEISSKSVKPHEYPNRLYEHYSIPAYDDNKEPEYQEGKEIKSNKYVVNNEVVLVSKLNPSTKRIWKPLTKSNDAICSTEFIVYVPKLDRTLSYVYEYLNNERFQNLLISNATGSTGSRQRVRPKETLKYKIILPKLNLIQKYSELVSPIHSQIATNKIQNQKLRDLRDVLLPKLMSGEIQVPLNEEMLEEV